MSIFAKDAANDNDRNARRDELIERLVGACRVLRDEALPVCELEEVLLGIANEFVRRVLERELQGMSENFGDEIAVRKGATIERYRRHQRGKVRYFSLCGPLDIERWTYRLIGKRNGPTVDPVELRAGLMLKTTPALAYALAQGHAKSPVRSVEEDLVAAHRQPPSRATMDRIARGMGIAIHQVVGVLEPIVRREEELPTTAHAVNIGLDRTTVPMEEPGLKDGRGVRRKKCKIEVNYRMAYVGTVCVTNRGGDVLEAWRYAAPAHEGPKAILDRMMCDVNRALEQNPRLKLGVVQDGAPEMWNLLRDSLRSNPPTAKRRWRETVDRFHFLERVASLLEIFHPEAKNERKRKRLLAKWRREIDESDLAPKRIHDWFERESLRLDGGFLGKKHLWSKFDAKLGCYMLRQEHFHYASLAKDGLHSGSGVTEGACKSLITTRAKRSGQRWTKNGITAVLALRSLLASGRLTAVWKLFAERHQSHCANAA